MKNYTKQQIERAIREVIEEEPLLTDTKTNAERKDLQQRAHETYLKHLLRSEIKRMVALISKRLNAQRRGACTLDDVMRITRAFERAQKGKPPHGK